MNTGNSGGGIPPDAMPMADAPGGSIDGVAGGGSIVCGGPLGGGPTGPGAIKEYTIHIKMFNIKKNV